MIYKNICTVVPVSLILRAENAFVLDEKVKSILFACDVYVHIDIVVLAYVPLPCQAPPYIHRKYAIYKRIQLRAKNNEHNEHCKVDCLRIFRLGGFFSVQNFFLHQTRERETEIESERWRE